MRMKLLLRPTNLTPAALLVKTSGSCHVIYTVDSLLIVRSGGLGDTLLLWPALCAVRRLHPELRIGLFGRVERCRLLAVPGGADEALDIEGSGFHLLYRKHGSLPEAFRRFDRVVVFAGGERSLLEENLGREFAGRVNVFSPFPPSEERRHLADYLIDCLSQIGLAQGGAWPTLPPSAEELARGRAAMEATGCTSPLVIAPGSASAHKNWPAENFARLASIAASRGFPVVLLAGPADREAARKVDENLPAPPPRLPCPDPASLKGALALARLLIGNDSGPTHLAALLGKPTLAVFGPTDPRQWAPCGPRAGWLGPQNTSCAPCPAERMKSCPEKSCFEEISPEEVWQAAERLLQ
jgi:heptosyltransferase-3